MVDAGQNQKLAHVKETRGGVGGSPLGGRSAVEGGGESLEQSEELSNAHRIPGAQPIAVGDPVGIELVDGGAHMPEGGTRGVGRVDGVNNVVRLVEDNDGALEGHAERLPGAAVQEHAVGHGHHLRPRQRGADAEVGAARGLPAEGGEVLDVLRRGEGGVPKEGAAVRSVEGAAAATRPTRGRALPSTAGLRRRRRRRRRC